MASDGADESTIEGGAGESELKAGLEPVEFQRRLVFVTFTVLFLGITGGTCLGFKIQKAEQYQRAQAETPPEAGEASPGGRLDQ